MAELDEMDRELDMRLDTASDKLRAWDKAAGKDDMVRGSGTISGTKKVAASKCTASDGKCMERDRP